MSDISINYHEACLEVVAINQLKNSGILSEEELQEAIQLTRERVGLPRIPAEVEKDVCTECHGSKVLGGGNGHKSVTCFKCGGTGKHTIRI